MKIVFICGPLTTGGDGSREYVEKNVRIAEKYQIALASAGVGAFCPHTHTYLHNEKGSTSPESYYYDLDMEFLRRTADAVLAVPGWEKSRGATGEVAMAKELGLPVFYPTSPDAIEDVVQWAQS